MTIEPRVLEEIKADPKLRDGFDVLKDSIDKERWSEPEKNWLKGTVGAIFSVGNQKDVRAVFAKLMGFAPKVEKHNFENVLVFCNPDSFAKLKPILDEVNNALGR